MATNKLEIYKCSICGNMVEVVHTGAGTLVCCGQDMNLLKENSVDAATEKHVPVITKENGGIKVSVGSVAHPMADDHYIEWIELLVNGKSYTQFLEPGAVPEAFFPVDGEGAYAREFCNLHGLWRS